MPTLRQKNQHYYAIFYDPDRRPKQKWITLRTKNKSAAMRRLVELEKEHSAGRFDPWQQAAPDRGIPLSTAITRFLKRPGMAAKTVANYRDVLDRFARGLPPDLPVVGVQPAEVRAFCYRRGLSAASQATYYRHLGAFFKWAVKEGLVRSSPCEKVEKPKEGKKEAHYFTPTQVDRLIATIERDTEAKGYRVLEGQNVWLIDAIRFAVATGLRRGELVNLRWSDVDLESGFLVVRNRDGFRTKSGHDRRVPLVADAYEIAERLDAERRAAGPSSGSAFVLTGARGEQIDAAYMSKKFRAYRKLAGLPDELHFHSLRHTAASWLVMRGVSLPVVQAILGHADILVTQRYAHLAPRALRDEMARAFGEITSRRDVMEEPAPLYRLVA